MKRKINIYKNLNEPYEIGLQQGLEDTPEERFIKFFINRMKFRQFMGIQEPIRKKITIRQVTWI